MQGESDPKALVERKPEQPFINMLEQAETMVEYSAALVVADLANRQPDNRFNKEAREYVKAHSEDPICWMVPCIICGKHYEFWTTIDVSVGMFHAPRGICGDHSTGDGSTTIFEA
jgi:hypothetical protein